MTLNNKQFQQLKLMNVAPLPEPRHWDYDPEAWLNDTEDIHWHASMDSPLPEEAHKGIHNDALVGENKRAQFGSGFHVGTKEAALDRVRNSPGAPRAFLHPVRMSGELGKNSHYYGPFDDHNANHSDLAREHLRAGRNVPYINDEEDSGSISHRAPRQNLSTWAEDVLSDPGAPRHWKLAAEQFDLTVPMTRSGVPVGYAHGKDSMSDIEPQLHLSKGPSADEYGRLSTRDPFRVNQRLDDLAQSGPHAGRAEQPRLPMELPPQTPKPRR